MPRAATTWPALRVECKKYRVVLQLHRFNEVRKQIVSEVDAELSRLVNGFSSSVSRQSLPEYSRRIELLADALFSMILRHQKWTCRMRQLR
jgi:hypothetical protein